MTTTCEQGCCNTMENNMNPPITAQEQIDKFERFEFLVNKHERAIGSLFTEIAKLTKLVYEIKNQEIK